MRFVPDDNREEDKAGGGGGAKILQTFLQRSPHVSYPPPPPTFDIWGRGIAPQMAGGQEVPGMAGDPRNDRGSQ